MPAFRLICLTAALLLASCASRPGAELRRDGDEIMAAGRLFHTGARVVLWTEPGGYDAYRVEKRFAPWEASQWDNEKPFAFTPNRYGPRRGVDDETRERVRGGGWTLDELRERVDQVVLHYDASGTSRNCFRVLHDERGLSIHFMIDLDGTIYQTLDLKERAWHATVANDRSIGIEIANIGAYPPGSPTLARWYARDEHGPRVALPSWLGDGGVRTPGFVARPARPEPVRGVVGGRELEQYDFTPEQYEALSRLVAALTRIFPRIEPDYPREGLRDGGGVLTRVLTPEEFASFRGVLGHWHIQENKVDPGPALDWERVVAPARRRATLTR